MIIIISNDVSYDLFSILYNRVLIFDISVITYGNRVYYSLINVEDIISVFGIFGILGKGSFKYYTSTLEGSALMLLLTHGIVCREEERWASNFNSTASLTEFCWGAPLNTLGDNVSFLQDGW